MDPDISPEVVGARCPHLPVEIWTQIIGEITDSRYIPRAWLYFRRVSHMFKEATETAFAHRHLCRNTDIWFPDERIDYYTEDGDKVSLSFTLVFHRLSEDGSRAIFRFDFDDKTTEWQKTTKLLNVMNTRMAYGGTLYGKIRETLEAGLAEPDLCPRHILTVRRVVNDTTLPGVEFDRERDELSVLWKPMLSMLFGEDEFVKWAERIDYGHGDERADRLDLASRAHAGEISYEDAIKEVLDQSAKAAERVAKSVRRMRVMRWYEKNGKRPDEDFIRYHVARAPDLTASLNALYWCEFDDEWQFEGDEEGKGTFYDGMGLTFGGFSEKDLAADDEEEEWDDEMDEDEDDYGEYEDEEGEEMEEDEQDSSDTPTPRG